MTPTPAPERPKPTKSRSLKKLDRCRQDARNRWRRCHLRRRRPPASGDWVAPAGSYKVTAILQAVVNQDQFGMSLPEAISAERFHGGTGAIQLEESASADLEATLIAFGRDVARTKYGARLATVQRTRNGRLLGASDPRGGAGLSQVA